MVHDCRYLLRAPSSARRQELPAKMQQDSYGLPPGDSYGLPFARVVQLQGISFNKLVAIFFLELVTKSTLEKYPQETTSPWKLGWPCLRYCGRLRGSRRYRVSSLFVRNCGI